MRAVRFIGKLFAILLTALFCVLSTLFIFTLFLRFSIGHNNITNSFDSIDVLNIKSEELVNGENKSLKEQISEELVEIGVPLDIANNILDNKDINHIIADYVANYVQYITYGGEKPILDDNKILKLFEKEYQNEGLDFNSEHDTILTYISSITEKINSMSPSLKDFDNMGYDTNIISYALKIVNSNVFLVGLLGVIILTYILIAVCLVNKIKAVSYISVPIIFEGIVLIGLSLMEGKFMGKFINNKGAVDSLLLSLADVGINKFLLIGIILIFVGFILLVTSIILSKRSKEHSDKLLDDVIHEEVKKSATKEKLKDHVAVSDEDIDKIDQTMTKIEESNSEDFDEEEKDTEEVEIVEQDSEDNEDYDEIEEDDSKEDEVIIEKTIEDVEEEKEEDNKEEKPEYVEIDEEDENIIVNKDVDIEEPESAEIEVVSPKKGKDIEVDLSESEEDIEML